jgi:hypothetical protein
MSDNEIDFTQLQDNEDPDDDEGASQSVLSTSSIADTSSSHGGPNRPQKRKVTGASRGRRKVTLRRRALAGNACYSTTIRHLTWEFSIFCMSHWT